MSDAPELFTRPVETLCVFAQLLPGDCLHYLVRFGRLLLAAAAVALVLAGAACTPLAPGVQALDRLLLFTGWWVGLGVLSSIGMGTGLHTFVLYLAPKTARFTLASWECGALAEMRGHRWQLFPRFECPPAAAARAPPSLAGIWRVMALEGFLWALGTTLGELPPFLLSRSARAAEDRRGKPPAPAVGAGSFLSRALAAVKRQLKRSPFATVLLLASFPNPLFDACGLLCGYGRVPFSTFFFATALGKVGVKVNLQLLFIVAAFSPQHLDRVLGAAEAGPLAAAGARLRRLVERKRRSLAAGEAPPGDSWLGSAWNTLLSLVVAYYLATLVSARVAAFYRREGGRAAARAVGGAGDK